MTRTSLPSDLEGSIPWGFAAKLSGLALLLAVLAPHAGATGGTLVTTANPFLSALWVILGSVVVWCFFYWGLYPSLLRHFGEVGARAIFWPGVLLYLCTWFHLSSYTIYTFGFYLLWFQWTSLALVGLLAFWFLISFVRS
ncbi:MAG: hypothetical protein K0U98_05610 [Deltaproteobacteria bacterium]|nr:hypothetical protein [Deltaproteobacteria bacterium]